MGGWDIEISDRGSDADSAELKDALNEFNFETTGYRDGRDLSCYLRDTHSFHAPNLYPALGYEPYPSDSNFVFFGGIDDPNAVFEALFARDILIRDVGIPGHLRVTAGTAEETDYFLRSLAEVSGR